MENQGVCWGILAALVSLVMVLLRNGYLLARLTDIVASGIAAELGRSEAWRCKWQPEKGKPNAPPNTSRETSNPDSNLY